MSAIILDTETTGVDEPDVIQLAHTTLIAAPRSGSYSIQVLHFRPTKPISFGAMATHHIIPADVEHASRWPGSWDLPGGTEYLIGHNVDYDWKAIGSPDVRRICTLALARSLWPQLDSHSLGALIYAMHEPHVARSLLRTAHDASTDVALTVTVLDQILQRLPLVSTWHDLWLASEKARVPKKFWFGKYEGRDIAEIRRIDPGYIQWCLTKCDQVTGDPYAQKAMRGEA